MVQRERSGRRRVRLRGDRRMKPRYRPDGTEQSRGIARS
jgi:hypothetical protein